MIELRTALADDLDFVRKTAREAYAPYVERLGFEPPPMVDDFGAKIEDGLVRVIVRNRVSMGFVIYWIDGQELFVENIAIAPAAHGGGIARAVFASLEAEAQATGCTRIRLYTNAKMTENLAIYPRLGFQETERRREHGLDRVYFEKAIS